MERPKITSKEVLAYVEYLEQELDKFNQSPYKATYITLKSQIDSFNEQLTIGSEETKTIEIDGQPHELVTVKGKIDLFASKDAKEFDRAYKYLDDCLGFAKNLAELKKLLTPEERKDIEAKLEQAAPLAERIALADKRK